MLETIGIVLVVVALIAVGAFIKVPVPVVPFTLQFLFTMLADLMTLRERRQRTNIKKRNRFNKGT